MIVTLLTLFHNTDQYEIYLKGNIIQRIHLLSWSSPKPQILRFAELSPEIQDLIIERIEKETNEEE